MGQQALNRKPDLSVRRTLQLDANTEIAEIGITVRKQMELTNNKSLTDAERGMHLMASKILVNGQPIVYDDLMDGFTTEELEKITEFLHTELRLELNPKTKIYKPMHGIDFVGYQHCQDSPPIRIPGITRARLRAIRYAAGELSWS